MVSVNRLFIQLLLLSACVYSACTRPAPQKHAKYSVLVMSNDHKQYILQTDTLDHGVADPIRDGALLASPPRIWYYMLVKNGFYYFLNSQNHYFVKSRLEGKRIVPVDSVLLPDFSHPDNCVFYHPDSVLISNGRMEPGQTKQYARIDVRNMKAQTGYLPVPAPQAPFNAMSTGFMWFSGPHLWLGYTYHFNDPVKGYGSADTVYLAQINYPSMQLQHIEKDARSTYPGNVNTSQQNTLTDEKGDFYFLSCPGIVRGGNPSQPTAIYRISGATQQLDTAYFFNISTSPVQNHAYGLWYIGNGQAIVRSERKDLFKTFEEHYLLPHIEFYVVDLHTQSTRKLDLPLDRGSSRSCVLAEDGKAFISINDGKGNNDIWIYDPAAASLQKGLHLTGNIDYIFRIERLYDEASAS